MKLLMIFMIRLGFQFALTSFLILNGCGASDSSKDANSDGLFTDAAEHMGLNFTHDPGVDGSYFMPESIGSGCAFLDYDNDGHLDIYLVNGAQHGRSSATDLSIKKPTV